MNHTAIVIRTNFKVAVMKKKQMLQLTLTEFYIEKLKKKYIIQKKLITMTKAKAFK